ncbi:MAG: DNA-binding transcriptional regulator BolA [Cellvibrionales bacterium UBA7375]|nr:MAG: DNA-binding transcriptional regulator BolA [Cellvibrionales bacterium UBA7375]
MGPLETGITQKLAKAFSPAYLEVINESASHNVPEGSESHFKIIIVSEFFCEKPAVKRHQAIYAELSQELKDSIHALSLFVYTQEEWKGLGSVPKSPKCMGGT